MRIITLAAAGAGLLVAALLYGCAGLSRSVSTPVRAQSFLPAHRGSAARAPVIGVLVAGWHTGLILPARELGPLRSLLPAYPDERYVSFGWGNRRFYMARSPTFSEAVAALFSSPSVVLVEGAPTLDALLPSGGKYRWLCADRQQVRRLDTYLLDALRRRGGRPIDLGTGPRADSEFIASSERYDAFHTCNTWTAEALEDAGLAVHAGGVIFSSQLKDRLSHLAVC